MRIKIFLLLTVSALISSCGSMPKFPKGDVCPLMWTGDMQTSYASCRDALTNVRTKRKTVEEAVRDGDVVVPIKFYGDIRIWAGKVQKWGEEHCK